MRLPLLSLVALCAAPALAQTPPGDDQTLIVTGIRSGEPTAAADLGASITLLSPEQLTARQTRSVSDILRDVPGIAVNRTSGLTQLRLRGAEANQTLVLIDGIEVSDPFLGEFDFSSLIADEDARIEVLRGQQSALYGSDAIGGVIQYITASGRDAPGLSARIEAGSDETVNALARWGGVSGAVDYAASLTYLSTEGDPDTRGGARNLGAETLSGAAKANWTPSGNFRVRAVGRLVNIDRDFNDQDFTPGSPSFGYLVDSPGVRLRNDSRFGLIRAELDLLDHSWTHAVTAQIADARRDTFEAATRLSGSDGQRLKGSYETAYRFTTGPVRHRATFAADFERERFRNDDPTGSAFGGRRRVENIGLVGQYELFLDDRATLSGAVRYDDNKLFRNTTTYRVQGSYRVLDATRIRAAAGSGVKNPNLFELYGFIDGRFIGNANLKPETSEGWEAGAEQGLFDGRVTLGATYFRNVLKDEIFTDFPPPDFTPTPGNRTTRSRQRGVEASLAGQLGGGWRIDAAYTYLHARENGVEEVRRPDHIASASVSWTAKEDRGNATLVVRYNGRARDDAFLDPSFVPTRVTLDDYVLVNLAGRVKIGERLELFGRIENLFDERYEDVFSFVNPGRGAYAGLRVRL